MTAKRLIYNARILTQADGLVVDSVALNKGRIESVGRNLEHDPDFRSYRKIEISQIKRGTLNIQTSALFSC